MSEKLNIGILYPIDSLFPPYTRIITNNVVTEWNSVYSIDNSSSEITVILPTANEFKIGAFIEFWFESDTAANNISINSPNDEYKINTIESAIPSIIVSAKFEDTSNNYKRVMCRCIDASSVLIESVTEIINTVNHYANFLYATPSLSTGYDHFVMASAPVSGIYTVGSNWFVAFKVEKLFESSSTSQALYTSNSYGMGLQGDGTGITLTITSEKTILPFTLTKSPAVGEWVIIQFSSVVGYQIYINAVNVLNGSPIVGSTAPPAAAPTSFTFAGPPGSVQGLNNNTAGFSTLVLGSSSLTVPDIALFTTDQYIASEISPAIASVIANEWLFSASSPSTNVGTIALAESPGATNISYVPLL